MVASGKICLLVQIKDCLLLIGEMVNLKNNAL